MRLFKAYILGILKNYTKDQDISEEFFLVFNSYKKNTLEVRAEIREIFHCFFVIIEDKEKFF